MKPRRGGPVSARHRHLPGLDGLRGVAVLGVLAFHSGWPWARGGFLGVSLFFTLSGFLITRLLVLEHRDRTSIDLRAFFSRRARRLLPAAFAAIALAVIVTMAVGTPSQARDLPRDAFSSSFYVANWSFLLRGSSYVNLFDAASPLQHMWSLAIEEQLYLVVPLVLTGCFALRGRRFALMAVTWMTVALGTVSLVTSRTASIDTLYYGTHIRAVELLGGVLLALAVTAPRRTAPVALARFGGPAALLLIVGGWGLARSDDAGLFAGPVILHAVLVAIVLWSVIDGVGVLARFLEQRPLVWLGRRSYGIYVFHWPLFIFFEQLPSAPPRPVVLALAWSTTMVIAAASYRWFEQPIRTGRSLPRPALARSLAFSVPAVLVAVALAASSTAPDISDPVVAAARLDELTSSPATTVVPTPTPTSTAVVEPVADAGEAVIPEPPGPPPRLAVFGDSTAAATGLGLARWALETGSFEPVPGVHVPGCSLVSKGSRDGGDREFVLPEGCDWRRTWPQALAAGDPDVIVISIGGLDMLPWSLPGVEGRVGIGDEVVDQIVRDEIDGINAMAVEAGTEVVWLTLAPPVGNNGTHETTAGYNRMIRTAASAHPAVDVLDYASVVIPWSFEEDKEKRSDGVHLDEDASLELARDWLGPELLELLAERTS